ncbi:MAG: formylglycine-generating enzyme family protein, partial [Lentisphaerae bacterium]|nr:formylglycine-generating enzyme family protein [Lentisphaerota bacterium]
QWARLRRCPWAAGAAAGAALVLILAGALALRGRGAAAAPPAPAQAGQTGGVEAGRGSQTDQTGQTARAAMAAAGAPPAAAATPGPGAARAGLRVPSGFRAAPGAEAEPYTGTGWAREVVHETTGIAMVYIPAGSFTMGSPETEAGRRSDERQHGVTLTRGFYMGQCEVTQGQWERVMGSNPSKFKGAGLDAPVEMVSWDDCQAFCRKLGEGFRLPTEAEWEYACRAGTATALYTGSLTILGKCNAPDLDPIAWYSGNSGVTYAGGTDTSGWAEKQYPHDRAGTHPVGKKQPNPWGLYDMVGNVWERCQDWYGVYPSGAVKDPAGPREGAFRVIRGGSYGDFPERCRSDDRLGRGLPASGILGCRVVRTVP